MTEKNNFHKPTKKETLAIKQAERVRRIASLRQRLPEFSPQWWVGVGEVVAVVALFLINFFLLNHFFGHEDMVNVFSAPVIPLLASLTEFLIPFSYGVRIWLLIFSIFLPLTFYYFVREISGRKLAGLIAAFIAILPVGIFLPLRINLGLLSEDGAHIVSLTFIPIICLVLLRFLRRGSFWMGIFSALGTTIVALTSPLGLVILTVFLGVITFSEMLLGQGRIKAIRLGVVLALTMGFSAFWYNPKFVILTLQSSQGQLVEKTLANLIPISFFLLPLLGIFGFLLFENRPQLQPMFIALFLTVAFGLFSLGAGIVHPAHDRFLPAFGISLAFLIGIAVVGLSDFFLLSPRIKQFKIASFQRRVIAFGLLGIIFSIILVLITLKSQNLWGIEEAKVLGLTAEQKVGIWEIKEETGLAENIFGWAITGLTGLGTTILKIKLNA